MHLPGSNLLVHLLHLTSPSHRRAAKERKREYERQFAAYKEENSARVRRMSELRGEMSPDDFLYDSAWGTGAASRARSRGMSRTGSSRPTSMLWDSTSAFGYTPGAERAVPPLPGTDGYASGGSYDSNASGMMRRETSSLGMTGSVAPSLNRNSIAVSRTNSENVEVSGPGGLQQDAESDLPPPPEYVGPITTTTTSRKKSRPLSWFGGMETADGRRPFSRSQSRGTAGRRDMEMSREGRARDGVQVTRDRVGRRELRMGAIVA